MYMMQSRSRLKEPNARDMHTTPVVTGAGAVLIALVAAAGLLLRPESFPLLAAAAALAAVSWIDDHCGGLSPAFRLLAQATAVLVVLLSQLDGSQRLVPAIPFIAERFIIALAWIWFINLFNFMDGIDGLAASETICISVGYLAVAATLSRPDDVNTLALLLAGATAGYIVWNWHPAKVMMGDSGSIPLGFLLGWLLIDLSLQGHFAAAAILPIYFVTDATYTLLKRITQGELPWKPHRQHAYQRAAMAARSHAAIVATISAANITFIALAAWSVRYPLFAFVLALILLTLLMVRLEQIAGRELK
jgi:UDP-N-acetylmuramyl pentapeptide phosphotransferase/UDP-N-acetylglucosamine-1-phosphate transferase